MNQTIRARTIAIAAIALFATAAFAPLGVHAGYPAGTVVGKGDFDYTPWPSDKSGKISLCAVDKDKNGAYTPREPLYIDTNSTSCFGTVAEKDIRLTAYDDLPGGKEVKMEDADHEKTLIGPIPHQIKFFDMAGEGEFSDDGVLYLDLFHEAQDRIDAGDLRLTAFGAHAPLTFAWASDGDMAAPLTDVLAGGRALTDAPMTFKAGSAYYINTAGKAINTDKFGVSDKDVRLTDKAKGIPFPDASEADVVVQAITVPGSAVRAARPFQVHMTVRNDGGVTGAGLVSLTMDGVLVDARGTPSLAPGEEAILVVTLWAGPDPSTATLAAGAHVLDVTVDPAPVTEVAASASAAPAPDHGSDFKVYGANEPQASAGPRAAAVAESPLPPLPGILLLALALVAMVRQRRT